MTRDAYAELVDVLAAHGSNPKQKGSGAVRASCPGPLHNNGNRKSPALTVTKAPESVLVHCHVGCSTEDVLKPLGWTLRDLYDNKKGSTYAYMTEGLKVNRIAHREYKGDGNKKGFYQSRHKPGGVANPVILYRLPQLRAAVKAGKTVYLVEGEKDVDLLESLGEAATTAPQGVDSFHKVDPSPLEGSNVVAIVDRDGPGDKWAGKVRELVGPVARTLTFKKADLNREGADFTDHYAAGKTIKDLLDYNFPKDEGEAEPAWEVIEVSAHDVRAERPEWLWEDRLVLEQLNLVSGRGGEGKSTLMLDTAAKLSRGTLPGKYEGKPQYVAVSAHEDDLGIQKLRLQVAGADMRRVKFWTLGKRVVREDGTIETSGRSVKFPRDLPPFRKALDRLQPAMWIIDPISSIVEGDPYKAGDVRESLEPLVLMLQGSGTAIVGIKHFTKGQGRAGDLLGDSHAWRDVARSHIPMVIDPETEERIYTLDKGNYSKEQGGSWKFALEDTEVTDDNGLPWNVAKVKHLGQSSLSVDQVINRPHESEDDHVERNEAQQFVLDYLRGNGGQAPAGDVMKAGRGAGFTNQAMTNARRRCRSPRISSDPAPVFGGGWVWTIEVEEDLDKDNADKEDNPKVPPQSVEGAEDANLSEGDTLGTFGEDVTPSPNKVKWRPGMKLVSSSGTQTEVEVPA